MHSSEFYLGIDGGGTKNRFVLLNQLNKIILDDICGPANFQQTELFFQSMQEMMTKLSKVFKKEKTVINLSVYAGFAGVAGVPGSVETITQYYQEKFAKIGVKLKKCQIVSDAVLVLDTYFYQKSGIILISGTGSICLARNKKNDTFRAGGFGHLLDDIGSGYYFGKMAIKIALESSHHFKAYSPLEELVKEHYRLDHIDEVVNLIYNDPGKAVTASASPLLFLAAQQGCKYSQKAIFDGIKGLINLVKNCRKAIREKNADLILHGTVFRQKILLDQLRQKLKSMKIEHGDKDVALSAANLAKL